MKGALVFLAVFVIGAVATISNPTLPPGLTIYHMMGQPDTDYQILGLAAPTFAAAILNGVIYGIIGWVVYSIVARGARKKETVDTAAQTPVKTA